MFLKKNTIMAFAILLSLIFILVSCQTTGGHIGVGWGTPSGGYEQPEGKSEKNKKGPPSHAPAHGYRAKHQYRYYPSSRVYYDTQRDVYFYLKGDNWQVSASLPGSINLKFNDFVEIELDTDRPYIFNEEHQEEYPPGKMKKNKKKKKKY